MNDLEKKTLDLLKDKVNGKRNIINNLFKGLGKGIKKMSSSIGVQIDSEEQSIGKVGAIIGGGIVAVGGTLLGVAKRHKGKTEQRVQNIRSIINLLYKQRMLESKDFNPETDFVRLDKGISQKYAKKLKIKTPKCADILVYLNGGRNYMFIEAKSHNKISEALKQIERTKHIVEYMGLVKNKTLFKCNVIIHTGYKSAHYTHPVTHELAYSTLKKPVTTLGKKVLAFKQEDIRRFEKRYGPKGEGINEGNRRRL